jgi:hypothetical protein
MFSLEEIVEMNNRGNLLERPEIKGWIERLNLLCEGQAKKQIEDLLIISSTLSYVPGVLDDQLHDYGIQVSIGKKLFIALEKINALKKIKQ